MQTVAEYLRKIHPTSWTKFGNCSLAPEEIAAIEGQWNAAEAYGDACSLFGGRTTSAIEGQNNALLLAGIRDSQVFGALILYCNVVVETLTAKKKNARDWIKDKHTVTPRAKKMFDRHIWSAAVCTVRKSTDSVFHVDDSQRSIEEDDPEAANQEAIAPTPNNDKSLLTFTVDLESGTCTRCAGRQHLQLPCRHLIAALYSQSGLRTSTAGVYKFFHGSFTATSYARAFQNASVSLPFVAALLRNPNIQSPSMYNQAGGSAQRAPRDDAIRDKRYPSRGEPKGSKPALRKKQQSNPQSDRVAVAASMREYFTNEIRAAEKKKRAKYTCSRCGRAEGHNTAKCPNRSIGSVDPDVHTGIYIVGNCPLRLLERRNAFVNTEVEIPNIISEYCF